MSDLPHGWEWATLGEIADSVQNGIFVSRPGDEPNGIPILRISSVRPMHLDLSDLRYSGLDHAELADGKLLESGDLLFTRYSGSREFVGACARVPDNALAMTYPDKLIRVRARNVNTRYLEMAFAAPTVRRDLEGRLRTTAGQVGISGSALKDVRVPIAPLSEQQRIVAVLDDHLSRLRAGQRLLLSASYRGQLATISKIQELIGRGKAQAQTVALGELVRESRYGTSTKCDYDAPGTAVLRIPNIKQGRIDLVDLKYAAKGVEFQRSAMIKRGDLLVVRTNGARSLIGRSAVAEEDIDCTYASYLIRLRLDWDRVLPEWADLCLRSPELRRSIEFLAASSAGQYNLSAAKLRSLDLPLPDLATQGRAVAEFSEFESSLTHAYSNFARTTTRAAMLRRSLLTEAFAGRLVPQDPADEPASDLLDRIRAERTAQPRARRTRKTTTS